MTNVLSLSVQQLPHDFGFYCNTAFFLMVTFHKSCRRKYDNICDREVAPHVTDINMRVFQGIWCVAWLPECNSYRKYAKLILSIPNDGDNPRIVLPQVTKPHFSSVTVHIVDFESPLNPASLGLVIDHKDGGCFSKTAVYFQDMALHPT